MRLIHWWNLIQMKCGQLSLPHKSLICLLLSPSSCFFWFSECSILGHIPERLFARKDRLRRWWWWQVEGWGCWHTLKHLHCASGCSIAQKDQKISLIRPTLRETLSESFHLFWHPEDSLKEPYVSSALSQQQYRAFLPYHANEVEIQTYCPAGKIRELTGCLMLAYCLGHRNKPGVQFTTCIFSPPIFILQWCSFV